VLALEERGHKLYGLWTADGHWFNTVGPLPFGHVDDLPRASWREAMRQLKPDLIYALLNWEAVPFAHQVLIDNPGIPFIWHFKEGPFDCIANGTWSLLVDLYTQSDGQIYCSPEARDWFRVTVPGVGSYDRSLVLDGDLPKRDWFTTDRSPRLSEADEQIHTVVPGRPIGLHPPLVAQLAAAQIHLHNIFYGTPAVNQPVDSTRDALAAPERVWKLAQAQARAASESAAEDDKSGASPGRGHGDQLCLSGWGGE
jgi:hypothetical protein